MLHDIVIGILLWRSCPCLATPWRKEALFLADFEDLLLVRWNKQYCEGISRFTMATPLHFCIRYEDVLQNEFHPWLLEYYVQFDFSGISRFPHEDPNICWQDHISKFIVHSSTMFLVASLHESYCGSSCGSWRCYEEDVFTLLWW